VRVCPIIREPDGLALSSRNVYLSPDERRRALSLSQALRRAEEMSAGGEQSVAVIETEMRELIRRAGEVDVQYVAFVADGTATPVRTIDSATTVAIAAFVGKTRLIDNLRIGE
jgi:pantoate--beta-alanine ligase